MLSQNSKDPNVQVDATDELPPEPIKLRRTISIFGQPAGEEDIGFNEEGQLINTLGLDLKHCSNEDIKKASPEIKQEFRVFAQNNPGKGIDAFAEVKNDEARKGMRK